MKNDPVFWRVVQVALISVSLKVLLFPTSFSTDLHVHRNWKAITYNRPLSHWYTESTSKWTLDYPPMFAYLEYVLSHVLRPFDPSLTRLVVEDVVTDRSVTLLRMSVLLAEVSLMYSVYHILFTLHKHGKLSPSRTHIASVLLLLCPGLTLVDNIHFQYNALPISMLLLTLSHLINDQKHFACITFCVALNLKHTLLPLVPTVSIYLLATLPRETASAIRTLSSLFVVTVATLIVPWLPFCVVGGWQYIGSICSRLFPFDRGLLHANWAPNFWSLYALVDRILLRVFPKASAPLITSGRIGESAPFAHLPNPTPTVCTALIIMSTTLVLLRLFRDPSVENLLTSTAYNLQAAFMFGWHVHEKAALLPLYPLLVAAMVNDDLRFPFFLFSLASQFALFELVRKPAESMFITAHFLAYHAFVAAELPIRSSSKYAVLVYAVGLVFAEAYCGVVGIHRMLFADQLQFLPILFVSVYSSLGVIASFLALVHRFVHLPLESQESAVS
ncbi:Dolichyl pyrophosphate [Gracilariopsis chorda]|uniref:Alpha-1,3-glucosyltransferase n=1 Tax=Gracilariopsis chorda TaxID=448386 RepID=A0A2V3IRH4_9FLOR|nr:Dolichyl pyrophosphate [Gracilariopsis chorda]|eukprot:PXF44722.1 Dolichyl pyrophosphate [Gracilariopsis chorda]